MVETARRAGLRLWTLLAIAAGLQSVVQDDAYSRMLVSRPIFPMGRDVGYLPSDLRLYSWMTAEGALRVAGRIRGLDLMAAGHALAERFELEPELNNPSTRRKSSSDCVCRAMASESDASAWEQRSPIA